jgi:hypothetical protein
VVVIVLVGYLGAAAAGVEEDAAPRRPCPTANVEKIS